MSIESLLGRRSQSQGAQIESSVFNQLMKKNSSILLCFSTIDVSRSSFAASQVLLSDELQFVVGVVDKFKAVVCVGPNCCVMMQSSMLASLKSKNSSASGSGSGLKTCSSNIDGLKVKEFDSLCIVNEKKKSYKR